MKCPVDGETLVMTERSGVEIDYCPRCRGVWLDRGELDKILERSAAAPALAEPPRAAEPPRPPAPAAEPAPRAGDRPPSDRPRRRDHDDDDHDDDRLYRRGRRKSFLDDLFDF
ncbi:MAG: zf-TFIIB domain-containing protein [Rhodobacteraceae bacterium]|nr:zf-TFIIB domain-containing protein [Paracoccaceae bacterium]